MGCRSGRTKRQAAASAFIILTAALTLYLAVTPLASLEAGPRLCLFHAVTGHNCPGCGMTRAIAAVLHLRFDRAVTYNPGVLIVFPLLCLVVTRKLFSSWRELRPLWKRR